MSESQELVSDFLAQLRLLNCSDDGIAPLGFEAASNTDRLDRDMRSKLAQSDNPVFREVDRIEECIDAMLKQVALFQTISKQRNNGLPSNPSNPLHLTPRSVTSALLYSYA